MVSRIVVKPETTRHRHADPSVQKEQLLKNPINKPYLCLVGRVPNDALKRLAKFQETALFSFRQTLAAVDRALPDLTLTQAFDRTCTKTSCITPSSVSSHVTLKIS